MTKMWNSKFFERNSKIFHFKQIVWVTMNVITKKEEQFLQFEIEVCNEDNKSQVRDNWRDPAMRGFNFTGISNFAP